MTERRNTGEDGGVVIRLKNSVTGEEYCSAVCLTELKQPQQ